MLREYFILFVILISCNTLVFADTIKCNQTIFVPETKGSLSEGTLVAGGTRNPVKGNNSHEKSVLVLLASENHIYSSKQELTLYWWSKQPVKSIVSIGNTSSPDKTAQFQVSESPSGSYITECLGINQLRLTDQGFRLKNGQEYGWDLTQVGYKARHVNFNRKVVFKGPTQILKSRLDKTTNLVEKAKLYAKDGYWYDAVEILLSLIELRPNDSNLERTLLVDLLENENVELKDLKKIILPPVVK